MIRVGIVAGEASGDILGAGLISAFQQIVPDAIFEGIAGPRMIEVGCQAIYPAEKLAVMGLVEVAEHFFEIHSIRKQLLKHFTDSPPDVFVGIDAPDFNLGLEVDLKSAGIPTVHYVSPSVWAWRQYRVKKIAKAVDLMLTLFPFETDIYEKYNVQSRFVGHPLADLIPLESDQMAAKRGLGLSKAGRYVALLPGSRVNEVTSLVEEFLKAAAIISQKYPDIQFLAPLTSEKTAAIFRDSLNRFTPGLPVTVFTEKSRQVMCAADVVLLASGTAALEALLLKKPMVVAYRVARLTYLIAKRMVKVKNYSLPNLLSGDEIVPELIQDDLSPERLAEEVSAYLEHPERRLALTDKFYKIHQMLRMDANNQAAKSVLELLDMSG
ncbi:MAG: lipid-A-disaccharide synthase [Gammaproteobacteria bacterium]